MLCFLLGKVITQHPFFLSSSFKKLGGSQPQLSNRTTWNTWELLMYANTPGPLTAQLSQELGGWVQESFLVLFSEDFQVPLRQTEDCTGLFELVTDAEGQLLFVLTSLPIVILAPCKAPLLLPRISCSPHNCIRVPNPPRPYALFTCPSIHMCPRKCCSVCLCFNE